MLMLLAEIAPATDGNPPQFLTACRSFQQGACRFGEKTKPAEVTLSPRKPGEQRALEPKGIIEFISLLEIKLDRNAAPTFHAGEQPDRRRFLVDFITPFRGNFLEDAAGRFPNFSRLGAAGVRPQRIRGSAHQVLLPGLPNALYFRLQRLAQLPLLPGQPITHFRYLSGRQNPAQNIQLRGGKCLQRQPDDLLNRCVENPGPAEAKVDFLREGLSTR